ncbi:hypothetical protein A3H22_03730 [Candidatus Peribacteria bacterium RIFCSPLOWO2_12_FULL_55_15]|nr:MAG: hypothetical protein A3D12_04250 [Candidatus Peribacteria bacterium RIFCSPHIGHO2_02_FULL_55_24]OGJ64788.1 MAG: hypothetical protein A3E47_00505 [Candidatus Peribacteria bacterium RIFCSPHIGHO2_12_FULL_54_10]OGJ68065.1 MAG: hypothetical protein A2947_01060 [Candidatus Peribacteria bacterium RIFCSPLOWO2_01_FULL_54_110]OGJ71820.1 MAG: hypothetical protein A3H22_03730 [Candidatus Peribacteria bacterium RIFCSPLOWO2_12_FULL_55_15]
MTSMDSPIRSRTDVAFLRRTRGEIEAHLENLERWTELMRSMTRPIPRENGKFGQDPLGKGLLAGIPTEEVDAALADTGPQARLRTLLQEIDQRIAMLTSERSSPEEPSVQPQKPAA